MKSQQTVTELLGLQNYHQPKCYCKFRFPVLNSVHDHLDYVYFIGLFLLFWNFTYFVFCIIVLSFLDILLTKICLHYRSFASGEIFTYFSYEISGSHSGEYEL
jgi:hypothetical protein